MYNQLIKNYRPMNEQEIMDQISILSYIEDYEHNILTRENTIAHITSSGFIMNKSLTKVLVIFHKIYQAWGWTGGHADGDENLLEVAIKEAMEETGLRNLTPLSEEALSMDILPVWGHIKNEKYISAHLHLNVAFVLIADEEEALIVNEEETEGVKWVDAKDIHLVSSEPELVYVYEKLIKGAQNGYSRNRN